MINLFWSEKSKLLLTTVLVVGAATFLRCSKVVDIDVPSDEPMLVIEGMIKEGKKPVVLLSMSEGYFDPINFDLDDFYLSDIDSISVEVDGVVTQLMEVPVAKLEQEQLEYLSQLFEVPTFYLQFANFPVYTVLETAKQINR